jgi:hypothetical protein
VTPPAPSNCTSLDAQETSPALPPLPRLTPAEWAAVDEVFSAAQLAADAAHPKNCQEPSSRYSRGHPLEVQSSSQHVVHAPYTKQRWPIVNALWNSADERLNRRAQRMGFCCSTPTIRVRGENKPFAALQRCRDRLCPKCATIRGKCCAAKTIALTEKMNAPRFITLTTKAKDNPLLLDLRHLICSFQQLRQTPEWKSWVKGGVYALEVTFNPSTHRWHPHLHILVDGEFIPQAKLKALWHRITRDSYIVHVKAVPDRQKHARYISAYVAKPADLHKWPPERIREYAEVLHGARMIQPFGNCLALHLDRDEEDADREPTRHVVHGSILKAAADRGDGNAQFARDVFARMNPDLAAAVGVFPAVPYSPTLIPSPDDVNRALCIALAFNRAFPDPPLALDFSLSYSGQATLELPAPLAGCEDGCAQGRCKCKPHEECHDICTLFGEPDPG